MSNNPVQLGRFIGLFPPFRARFPWLGGDLQTLRNTLHFKPPDLRTYPSERIYLPMQDGSGDSLWATLNRPSEANKKPAVVIIHGLTGCETSRNILASTAYHLARGHMVLRINLRNAGPSLGKCKHLYHAGRSQDLRDALTALPPDVTAYGLFLVGVSLGGNLLLKCLAERAGLETVLGAAAVCAPIDLQAAQQRIMEPRNFVYQNHLLRSLIADARCVVERQSVGLDLGTIRTIYDFDDRVVAPLAGFDSAEDYYSRSSAAPVLGEIKKPTLLITSMNDPWIPVRTYFERSWSQGDPLTVVIAPDGGHVGFHARNDNVPWHNRAIGAFLDSLL